MSEIIDVRAREILDSRGNPTVEVDVYTVNGAIGRAAVPSGASTGAYEATELRDKESTRYGGKGVMRAIDHIDEKIAPILEGMDSTNQSSIDEALLELDGTDQKSQLGANAILGVSLACAHAGAMESNLPLYQYVGGTAARRLPVPLMNVLNGGAHANNGLDVQEFMIVPVFGDTFADALRAGSEVFQTLKRVIDGAGLSTSVGDEGGFAPNLESNEKALAFLAGAVEKAGYRLGEDFGFALDVASTELFKDGKYTWEGKQISAEELTEIYASWKSKYPIWSIEDGCAEDDWAGWKTHTEKLGSNTQLVGDDIFVTNPQRLQKGINEGVGNSLLVKVNQIGTLSETSEAVRLAQTNGYSTVMSHRSGETEDTTIADLSVAMSCSQIKTGAPCRGERTAKYNRLLRIEEELGSASIFVGKNAFCDATGVKST